MIKYLVKNRQFLPVLTIPLIFSFLGLFFIFEASAVKSFNLYGDSFYYLKLQLLWLVLGVMVMVFFSFFDYHRLYYLAFFLMFLTIFLLILVLIPSFGYHALGARRWLSIGPFNLQPTELAKFSLIVYLSSWFIYKERKRFFSFLILIGFLTFLIILQPDMGTAIIIFLLSISLYYLAGFNVFHLLILLPAAFLVFLILIKVSPYRMARLTTFLNPMVDPLGVSYHINQIKISLANGYLLGLGFGASRQKYLFLPEAHTDSIFAIIAEELGFFGAVGIILMFLFFSYKIFRIAESAPDRFGRLLAGGIWSFFNWQFFINLGGLVNILPLTGVPLPFFSYGGSSLIISFALIGVLLNIEKNIKKT
jgi:cell division protein FtsW